MFITVLTTGTTKTPQPAPDKCISQPPKQSHIHFNIIVPSVLSTSILFNLGSTTEILCMFLKAPSSRKYMISTTLAHGTLKTYRTY